MALVSGDPSSTDVSQLVNPVGPEANNDRAEAFEDQLVAFAASLGWESRCRNIKGNAKRRFQLHIRDRVRGKFKASALGERVLRRLRDLLRLFVEPEAQDVATARNRTGRRLDPIVPLLGVYPVGGEDARYRYVVEQIG
jgi:hypothetical protein